MIDRLEERLEALRDGAPTGDWLDVQRRVRRRRTRRVATVLVARPLVAVALVPLGVAGRIVDLLTVEKTDEELPKPAAAMPPYVFGDRVSATVGRRGSRRRSSHRSWDHERSSQ